MTTRSLTCKWYYLGHAARIHTALVRTWGYQSPKCTLKSGHPSSTAAFDTRLGIRLEEENKEHVHFVRRRVCKARKRVRELPYPSFPCTLLLS